MIGKSKRGRPSAYRPEFVAQAERLCRLGATDEELGRAFAVDVRTIGNWKGEHADFFQALKAGRLDADAAVADSLYRKALSGDVTACIFWLKNRRPDQWRDRRSVDATITTKHSVEELSDAELEAIITAGKVLAVAGEEPEPVRH